MKKILIKRISWLFLGAVLGCLLISPSFGDNAKLRIVVVDFNNLSGSKLDNIGEITNQVLETLLHQTGKFDLLERAKLVSVLQEQQLSMNGLVDSESSRIKVGKLLSADYIVTGSIISYESVPRNITAYGVTNKSTIYEIKGNLKALNVTTGKIDFTDIFAVSKQVVDIQSRSDNAILKDLLIATLTPSATKLTAAISPIIPASAEKVAVFFDSTPSGADVEIDRVFYGNTPVSVTLTPGLHEVTISLSEYLPWSKTIDAAEGLKVACLLEKKPVEEKKIIEIDVNRHQVPN